LGSAKLFHEAPVHFGDISRADGAVLISVSRGAARHVQREIFYRIIFSQAAALPAGRRSAFYDEKRDARTVRTAGFKQCAKNFFLRRPSVNGGHGMNKIAVDRASRARFR